MSHNNVDYQPQYTLQNAKLPQFHFKAWAKKVLHRIWGEHTCNSVTHRSPHLAWDFQYGYNWNPVKFKNITCKIQLSPDFKWVHLELREACSEMYSVTFTPAHLTWQMGWKNLIFNSCTTLWAQCMHHSFWPQTCELKGPKNWHDGKGHIRNRQHKQSLLGKSLSILRAPIGANKHCTVEFGCLLKDIHNINHVCSLLYFYPCILPQM